MLLHSRENLILQWHGFFFFPTNLFQCGFVLPFDQWQDLDKCATEGGGWREGWLGGSVSATRHWRMQQRTILRAPLLHLSSLKPVCGGRDTNLPWQEAGTAGRTQVLFLRGRFVSAPWGWWYHYRGLRYHHLGLLCNKHEEGKLAFSV